MNLSFKSDFNRQLTLSIGVGSFQNFPLAHGVAQVLTTPSLSLRPKSITLSWNFASKDTFSFPRVVRTT